MASEDFRHIQTKWLERAMKSEKYCDAIFIVGRKRKRMFGFRGLLATISPVFEAQFYGSFREASSIEPIEYPAIKAHVFECIIRSSMNLDPNIDANNVMELIQVCQMFQIPQLQKECLLFLENSLNVDNVLCVLNTGYCLNSLDKKFYKKSLRIVLKNAPSMLKNSGFYSLHPDLLISFLKSNCFNVKEELLWNATLKWAQTVVNKNLRFPILNKKIYNHHCRIWQKCQTSLTQSVSTNKCNDEIDNISDLNDLNDAFGDLDDDIEEELVTDDDEDDIDEEDEKEIIMLCDYDENKVDKVLELITPYLRYALMDKQFFIDNVSNYLSPKQRDAVYIHFILSDRSTEIFNDNPRIAYSNKKFDVVASNVRLDKAKMLNHVDDWWSHTNFASISPQFFVVKLPDPSYIITIHWKNRWGDGETAKEVELQCSINQDKYDAVDDKKWTTFWSFKSEKTSNWLTFQVPQNENIKPSMFWRFMVKSLYGDNSCRCGLDQIKITNSL